MAFTTTGDLFVPEIFVEAIQGALPGMKALHGTKAAILNGTMPEGKDKVRQKINIPYFNTIGEFDDSSVDGDALPLSKIGDYSQQAMVEHTGKVFEITEWARMAAGGGDPYQEGARQIAEGFERRIDKALIDAALGIGASMTVDVSSSGSRLFDLKLLAQGKALFGDEQNDEYAILVVHSKVRADLEGMTDSVGRPLLTDPVNGGLPKFLGVPLATSDRLGSSGGVYTSVLAKAGAVVCWYNGTPAVRIDQDITVPSDVIAVHAYFAAHAYSRLPNRTKPGIALMKHN